MCVCVEGEGGQVCVWGGESGGCAGVSVCVLGREGKGG